MSPPLVVTADESLREELLRLAAAAGVAPDVVADPASALRGWARAPIVLVGADLAEPLADLAPDRRDGVHLIAWEPAAASHFVTGLALGAEDVVGLPSSQAWVVEVLTDLGEARRPPGLVVGVVGGSGGAGATTLACGLGQIAARRGPALVVDCDPLGPGLDRVLGLDDCDGFRWDALSRTTGRLSAGALREALPRRDGLGVLTWAAAAGATLQPFAVREALSAARRGHDTVVVDLPRAPDPVVDEVVARCDVLLVVVAPSVAGVASAARACARHRERVSPRVVVRGRGLDERDVARATGVPVLVTMPEQRGLSEALDLGLGPARSHRGPLARACRELLGLLPGLAPGTPGAPGTREVAA